MLVEQLKRSRKKPHKLKLVVWSRIADVALETECCSGVWTLCLPHLPAQSMLLTFSLWRYLCEKRCGRGGCYNYSVMLYAFNLQLWLATLLSEVLLSFLVIKLRKKLQPQLISGSSNWQCWSRWISAGLLALQYTWCVSHLPCVMFQWTISASCGESPVCFPVLYALVE